MNYKTIRAVAVLVGTTIGAGIYAIPYAVTKVGFISGLIYLVAIGLLVLLINLIYGEVILRTPGDHQLTGYGQIYYGSLGRLIATAAIFIGIYGAMFAYLIKVGDFISLVSNSPAGGLLFSLIFYFLASTIIFFGLKTVSKAEVILEILVLAFIFFLAFVSLPHLQPIYYQNTINILSINNLFLPYGVILFAFIGFSAIPEMEEILRRQPKQLKISILFGTLIPILIYSIFVAVIVGICGIKTSPDAISGLANYLPGWVARLGAGLGVLTMSTSFLALGYVLTEVWHRDFRFNKKQAFLLALIPPLILFLAGIGSFIQILEYTGAITGGLSGILIILCFLRARKQGQKEPAYQLKMPKIALLILGIIFVLGIFSPFFGKTN